jgi:O-antigen ligase
MMAAAMYASVISSASRAGTVLTTAEIILVPLLLWVLGRSTGRDVGAGLMRMGVILGVFTAVVGWESVWMRLWTPDPLGIRRQLALSTVQMIRSHPWFGTGLGTWPTVYPQYAIVDVGMFANQAHNDWLQWTAEGGFPLGIVLLTLFFWSLRPAFRTVWGLGILAVFLHAIVDYPFSRPALGSWVILILAMLAAESSTASRPTSGELY